MGSICQAPRSIQGPLAGCSPLFTKSSQALLAGKEPTPPSPLVTTSQNLDAGKEVKNCSV